MNDTSPNTPSSSDPWRIQHHLTPLAPGAGDLMQHLLGHNMFWFHFSPLLSNICVCRSVDSPVALLPDAPALEEEVIDSHNWQETVEAHVLASLTSREIDRQAVIYGTKLLCSCLRLYTQNILSVHMCILQHTQHHHEKCCWSWTGWALY